MGDLVTVNFQLQGTPDESTEKKNRYVEIGCFVLIFGILGFILYDCWLKNYVEGFTNQGGGETRRLPKLSSDQQGEQLDEIVRAEYDDLNRSLMGGAIAQRDQHFLVDDDGTIDDKLVHNMKCS